MSAWGHVPPSGDLPPYRLFSGDLEKPQLDDRQYRVLHLQNGLSALLVHDPDADKAAACLALTIGYIHDPIDAPGMAHFCEHMITKGSEPYPVENDFYSFITANGGSRNASTGPMTTTYWFTINPTKLGGALARQGAIFYAPRFTESLTAREINAVDSEYKRNLQNDDRRILQLTKHLSVSDHPWGKFGTGNYASLTEAARHDAAADEQSVLKETRRRLVEWWQQQYCASRMALAVIGRESLDELTAMAVPSFTKIPNRGFDPRPAIKERVWGPEHMGAAVIIQTVKDLYAFSLQFELPDLREHYTSRPADFVSHFLGHEGPDSIYAYLKKQGWLLDLTSGVSGHPRAVQLLEVKGTLTRQGYLHYVSVLEAIFEYIGLLRRSFPLEAYHYIEVATMAQTRFRFMQKEQPHTYAARIARELAQPYPPEQLLSGAYLYRERDEAVVQQLLEGFVPERARVLLLAKSHSEEVVGGDIQWETEKWYGTQYVVRKFQESLLQQASQGELREPRGHGELFFLPQPNPFISTDLSVDKAEVDQPAKYPTLVARTECAQLWHKKDDQFWVPKAHVDIVIKSPLAYATARHAMMTRLFVDLVDDALAEVTYAADLAGLTFSVSNHEEGITVSVGGYNDKLDVLLRTVLEKIRELSVLTDRLRVLKEKVQREYENFYLGQPSNLSENFARWLFTATVWTPAEKLTELDLIGQDDLVRHRDDLLSKVIIEMLVNGNVTRQRAIDLLSLTEGCLRPRPLLPSEVPAPRSLVLPPGSNVVVQRRHANAKELNSSLSYHCQFGASDSDSDVRLRSVAALVHHIIREPCFSTLRTQEQLGYVVAATSWSVHGSTFGLGIKVQSTRAPWLVEERVDAFLEAFRVRLAAFTDAEFATHKEGLIVKMLERARNLGEETARFWGCIRAGHYDFLRHETDAEMIRALTLAEVVAAYDALVRPCSPSSSTEGALSGTRRKLSVQLFSQQLRLKNPDPDPDQDPNQLGLEDKKQDTGHPGSAESRSDPVCGGVGVAVAEAGEGLRKTKAEGATVNANAVQRVIAAGEEDGGAVERAFKAGLACAPAVRPVVSAAFGGHDCVFPRRCRPVVVVGGHGGEHGGVVVVDGALGDSGLGPASRL